MSESKATAPEDTDDWLLTEDWALFDAVPLYTVSTSQTSLPATFWAQLTAATPALAARDAQDVEAHFQDLVRKQGNASKVRFGPQPATLESWKRLPDGSFRGRLGSSLVRLKAEIEGTFSDDDDDDGFAALTKPCYIVALGGRVYELGDPARISSAGPLEPWPSTLAVGAFGSNADAAAATMAGGGLPSIPTVVVSGLVGALAGLTVGLSLLPGLDPPSTPSTTVAVTRPTLAPAQSASAAPSSQKQILASQVSGLGTTAAPALVVRQQPSVVATTAPLTVAEQRQRQELAISAQQIRVDKDLAAKDRMEIRLRDDKQRLAEQKQRLTELQRLEKEKGSNSVLQLPRSDNSGS